MGKRSDSERRVQWRTNLPGDIRLEVWWNTNALWLSQLTLYLSKQRKLDPPPKRQVPACRWRILSLPGTDVVTLFIIPQKPVGLLCTSPRWNIALWATAILKEQKTQVLRNVLFLCQIKTRKKKKKATRFLEDALKLNSVETGDPFFFP